MHQVTFVHLFVTKMSLSQIYLLKNVNNVTHLQNVRLLPSFIVLFSFYVFQRSNTFSNI